MKILAGVAASLAHGTSLWLGGSFSDHASGRISKTTGDPKCLGPQPQTATWRACSSQSAPARSAPTAEGTCHPAMGTDDPRRPENLKGTTNPAKGTLYPGPQEGTIYPEHKEGTSNPAKGTLYPDTRLEKPTGTINPVKGTMYPEHKEGTTHPAMGTTDPPNQQLEKGTPHPAKGTSDPDHNRITKGHKQSRKRAPSTPLKPRRAPSIPQRAPSIPTTIE